jgi:16S rRNA (guanine527-N7)-methyltransferase
MRKDGPDCASTLDILVRAARQLGVDLPGEAQRRFITYCELLQDANERVNLTGVRAPKGIMSTLFLDSLTILPALKTHLRASPETLVVDVGSGAGFPGLPLKIVRPDFRLVLIESVGKKARFLHAVADALDLPGVTVLTERAETAGWRTELRDTAQICLARAVAPLSVLLELCAPFVHTGGLLAFPKSGDIAAEVTGAEVAARKLRVELLECWAVPKNLGLGLNRLVIVYRKVGPTPEGYPRRVGLARSRPLGAR